MRDEAASGYRVAVGGAMMGAELAAESMTRLMGEILHRLSMTELSGRLLVVLVPVLLVRVLLPLLLHSGQ